MVGVARALTAFLVLLGGWLAGASATGAMAAETNRVSAASIAASEKDPYADACAAARALIATDPERAVQLVVDVRAGVGNPTGAPSTAARAEACDGVLDQVVASQSLVDPQLDDDAYCDVLDALREADAEDQAARLADLREPPFTCDDTTETWVESAQGESPLDTSDAGEAWDDFVSDSLEPLAGIAAFVLAGWGALVVVGRLLVFVFFRDRKSSRLTRWIIFVLGVSGVIAGPVLVASGAIRDPVEPIQICIGVGLGMLAALLFGWWIGSIPRLTVEVSGEKKHGVDSGLIAAVLREMGGRAGRGIEIPVGPDITDLSTSVSEVSKNDWIALAQRILILITNVKPWRVQIEIIDEKTASIVIGRNGRQVAARRIMASDGRSGDDPAEGGCTDARRLAAFASGLIIEVMRERYARDFDPGLYGATLAGPIAQQYIAARWYSPTKDKQAALDLLNRALYDDPLSRLAAISCKYFQYSRSTDVEDLAYYAKWLYAQICALREPRWWESRAAFRDLRARLTLSYATAWRNWTATRAAALPQSVRDGWMKHPGEHPIPVVRKNATKPLDVVKDSVTASVPRPRRDRHNVHSRMRYEMLRVNASLLDEEQSIKDLEFVDGDSPSRSGRARRTRTASGLTLRDSPDIAFSYGCALARVAPGDGRVEEFIREAFKDSDLAKWGAASDPELLLIRTLPWFSKLTKLPEPELGVPPFKGYASKLNVSSREELAAYEWIPSSPLDATVVGRLRSSARISIAAERADESMPSAKQLGAASRTVLVRHLHERRVSPIGLDDTQLTALVGRLREVGYLGTLEDLTAWIAELNRALQS